MPTYEYVCKACDFEFERDQRISDAPVQTCPECRAKKVKRLISRTSFHLKGGGWYSDLYAKPKGDGKSDGEAKGEAKSEAKSEPASGGGEPKTESKPEKKADKKKAAKGGSTSGGPGSGGSGSKAAA
jgi:putative FmdB family regulatory protein